MSRKCNYGEDNTMLYLVGGVVALYFLYKYSISQGVASSVATDGSMASGVPAGTPSSANTPAMTPNTSNVAINPTYSGALSLFSGGSAPSPMSTLATLNSFGLLTPGVPSGAPLPTAPAIPPTVTSPSTVAPSQTAYVPTRPPIINTTTMQQTVNAQIAAGQVVGQVTYVNPSFIANATGPTKQLLLQQLAAGKITTTPPAWA